MNPHERNLTSAATAVAAPAPSWSGRRKLGALFLGLLVVGVIGYFVLRYFLLCGNCDGAPILCDDPCSLPTFGAAEASITGA